MTPKDIYDYWKDDLPRICGEFKEPPYFADTDECTTCGYREPAHHIKTLLEALNNLVVMA